MLERMSRGAGWLGTALFIGGLILFEINPTLRLTVTGIEIAALLFLILFFVVHFETVKSFSTRRSTKFGFNSLLLIILFISIIGILNFLASRHRFRMDVSETSRFTLADQTFKVLAALDREIKITGFTQADTANAVQMKDLLESYVHESSMVTYTLIDPDKKPAIAKNYGITQYDTLVLESGLQETQVKNLSEQNLTNAIIRVSKDGKRHLLFLKDHGEHSLEKTDKNGYSSAREALQNQGYEVEELSLLSKGSVPEETLVLVIAGPQKPLLPEETRAISAYLEKGGKVLVMIDPLTQPELDGFLAEWGLQLGQGLVVDTLSRLFGGDFTIPIVNTYPNHEITEGFNLATFYPLVQMITFDQTNPDFSFEPIAKTTPNSWSKMNLDNKELQFNPDEDIQGPLIIAGIVEKSLSNSSEGGSGESQDLEENTADQSTVVLFGDSDFAGNGTFFFSGNGDLFLNTINYLTKEEDLIAITPKEIRFSPLLLSRNQGQLIMYVSLFIVPITVVVTGLWIWRRRRLL